MPQPADRIGDLGDRGAPAAPSGMTRSERVRSAARGWQHRLSAVGGANTLLWYDDLPSGTLDLTMAHPGGLSMLMAGRPTRLSDLVRESSAFVEARARAVTIRDTANELARERGLVTSFLGIGLATWRIRSAPRPPAAPVLVRAATLRPTDGRLEDFMLDLAPAVELNPVLVHYLRSERGIDFDPDAVAALAHVSRRFDPSPVFHELEQLARGLAGFRIEDRRIVSTFPYAKLALVADLTEHGDALADHPVIAGLAGDPEAIRQLAGPEGPGGPLPAVGDQLDPAEELLILDADASQLDVIQALRAGRSVVVHAPPGTGVTQTVANTAAAVAADGKSVLVVAQDATELDDLAARLHGVGLGDLLVRVREGAHHRRGVVDAILATLDNPAPTPRGDLGPLRDNLRAQRAILRGHLDGMSRSQAPWGVSVLAVQTALAELAARPVPPSSRVRLDRDTVQRVDRAAAQRLGIAMAELAAAGAWEHGAHARPDPWAGARITTDPDAIRARDLVLGLSGERLDTDRRALEEALTEVGLTPPQDTAAYGRDLALVERVRQVRRRFRDDVLRRPLEDLLFATGDRAYRKARNRGIGWWARRALTREARALVRDGVHVEDLHGGLEAVQVLREDWIARAGVGAVPAVPQAYEVVCETWVRLERDLSWLAKVLAPTDTPGPFLETSWEDLRHQLARLAARVERVGVLPAVLPVLDDLYARGLGHVVDEFAARGVPPQECAAEVELIWWASVLQELAHREETYGRHDGRALRAVMAEYVAADEAHVRSGADQVVAALHSRRRAAVAAHPKQLAFLRRMGRGGRRVASTHEVLTTAPDVALAARPVWLMSPFVVAASVPPTRCFDLAIVIDAGRLEVPETLGALVRGQAVAAFGDTRRLGPAPFSVVTDTPPQSPRRRRSGEAPLSLMGALDRVVPSATLRWHHRCVDERLVAFANRRWYDGAMITVPGRSQRTPVEILDAPVEDFLEQVLQFIRHQPVRRPGESFGVVAVDRAAAERLRLALRDSLAMEPEGLSVAVFEGLESAEPGEAMSFTIRDPWGFQGITRDRVLVVLGPTGPDRGAQDAMPSTAALTVALTSARNGLTLMLPSEYREQAPSRWDSPAAAAVREFVAAADPIGTQAPEQAHEQAHEQVDDGGEAVPERDAVMTELAARLAEEGLTVHPSYGGGAHPIEIAVEDPRRSAVMVVAIDSDGPRARELSTVRDRDRLWPQQLARAGWEHVRVWSTDVFTDPSHDVARITEAVRAVQTRTSWSGRE
jgi:hypothetical protein